ncbi:MAG: hypothetical protein LBE09_08540 [Christensenellaceae bacterium]|jgi:hypothetical protein|nr:hypothetical protein [Christensenellaceae bacterium]
MGRKNKNENTEYDQYDFIPEEQPRVTCSFKIMSNCGPVPVARPAEFIQLTPIVQPIHEVRQTIQDDEYYDE